MHTSVTMCMHSHLEHLASLRYVQVSPCPPEIRKAQLVVIAIAILDTLYRYTHPHAHPPTHTHPHTHIQPPTHPHPHTHTHPHTHNQLFPFPPSVSIGYQHWSVRIANLYDSLNIALAVLLFIDANSENV